MTQFLAAALTLFILAVPVRAQDVQFQNADEREKVETGDARTANPEESGESFGDTISRILLRSVDSAFSGESEAGGVCFEPTSEKPLEKHVLDGFASALDGAWSRPKGAEAERTPTIMLEVCLSEKGESLRRPFLVEPAGSLEPNQALALIKALEAVEKVAPLASQPAEAERWRRILVLFDPLSGSQNDTTADGAKSGAPAK